MGKHEPWYKPRDEKGDDELLDWLGGRKDSPAQQGGGRRGCPFTAAPVLVAVVLALLAVLL